MKNILLLVPRMNIGGAESYVALVARSLKLLGYNVYVASAGGLLADKLKVEGIKHFFIPVRLSKYIAGFLLKRIVKKYNIDLIHANSEAAGIVAVYMRNKYHLDIPIIYTAHGVLPNKVQKYINQVDKIIAVSNFSAESAVKEGFNQDKISVIYNGVDTEKFKPRRKNKNELRKLYGIPDNAFCMVIISRIKNLRNKGHRHLLDMMHKYAECKKWHLVVIGKGKGLNEFKKLVQAYNLNDNVHILGHKTDVENYVDIADVMVLPSYFETFGLVIAEAMAMEKPAVAFDIGGIPEVIDDKNDGFLVKYNDDDDLFKKLNYLSMNKDICLKMGQRAREKIKEKFSNEIMMKKLISIYENLKH